MEKIERTIFYWSCVLNDIHGLPSCCGLCPNVRLVVFLELKFC